MILFSIFPGAHDGVLAKIRREFGCDWLELNPCAAHTFSLVVSHACYQPKVRRTYFSSSIL